MNPDALPENVLRLMSPADRAAIGKTARTKIEIDADNAEKMETSLHNLIMQYMNLREIFYIHSTFGKRTRSTPGTPDFVFAINGQACAIEAKTADGELSEDQEKAIAAMRKCGWAVEVCTSIQQVIGFIKRFEK